MVTPAAQGPEDRVEGPASDAARFIVGELIHLITLADRLGERKLAYLLDLAIQEARCIDVPRPRDGNPAASPASP